MSQQAERLLSKTASTPLPAPGERTATGDGEQPEARKNSPTLQAERPIRNQAGEPQSVVPSIYRKAMEDVLQKSQVDNTKAALKALAQQRVFPSREDAVMWLRNAMQGDARTEDLVNEYQRHVDDQLRTDADELMDQAASVRGQLARGGIQLIPEPYPGLFNFTNDNLWGLLAAAVLLSLGVPFWFNALKTLTNLRPLLATKQEEEQEKKGRG